MAGGFVTIDETANLLGVSPRQVRRLTEAGAISRVARGLVDADTVQMYLAAVGHRQTRSWAEHTAWAVAALLAGQDASWLGGTQVSRLRAALRRMTGAGELLTRMRNRADVHRFDAHRVALGRLREDVVQPDWRQLALAGPDADVVDGYVTAGDLGRLTRTLGLRANPTGRVVLRTTRFDFDRVRRLADTRAVAALDAATSTDPRVRGVGRAALASLIGRI